MNIPSDTPGQSIIPPLDKANNALSQNNPSPQKTKKKNRTLQFYKFLFYTSKVEVQLNEFLEMVRMSNQMEIALWLLSLILSCNTPKGIPEIKNGDKKIQYKNTLIWFHFFHVIRGIVGFLLWIKLPKAYEVIDKMKKLDDKIKEKKLFNDIVRDTLNQTVIKVFKDKKCWIYLYILLTAANFGFDIVDFFVLLFNINKASSNSKVVILTYFFISLFYLKIDVCYFIHWIGLYFVFPKKYVASIMNLILGYVYHVKKILKIGKRETDIKKEEQDKGVKIIEPIQGDSHKLPELNQQIVGTSKKKIIHLPQLNQQIVNSNSNNKMDIVINEQPQQLQQQQEPQLLDIIFDNQVVNKEPSNNNNNQNNNFDLISGL